MRIFRVDTSVGHLWKIVVEAGSVKKGRARRNNERKSGKVGQGVDRFNPSCLSLH